MSRNFFMTWDPTYGRIQIGGFRSRGENDEVVYRCQTDKDKEAAFLKQFPKFIIEKETGVLKWDAYSSYGSGPKPDHFTIQNILDFLTRVYGYKNPDLKISMSCTKQITSWTITV